MWHGEGGEKACRQKMFPSELILTESQMKSKMAWIAETVLDSKLRG